ncbi:MAG: transposase [Burkholderiales bacterium]|nr:transposase [Anaerolineae bacterium]
MRSKQSHTLSSREVHEWALDWLLEAKLLKDHGWLCTAAVVWNVVLRAAARSISVFAACRDLADGPCDQAVRNALVAGLPKTLRSLERRLNEALTKHLPRGLRRRACEVAIDWHLVPYYGQPQRSRNELYYGQPRQGTKEFHAYATACIVQYGQRYTLALTWVRRHEKTIVVLARLLDQIDQLGLKTRGLLLDRAFFNVPVIEWMQSRQQPFLMPAMFRGYKKKSHQKRKLTGLRWIKRQAAGWYSHTMKGGQRQVTLQICVTYRTRKNRKTGKRLQQKLLYGAWQMNGAPTEIRERYRTRFGIETSYRQMRQARIYTCTRDPHLRLLFVAVALLLRNLWVWIHETLLAVGSGPTLTLRLERLRFKRLLDWIASTVVALLHDGSTPYVTLDD